MKFDRTAAAAANELEIDEMFTKRCWHKAAAIKISEIVLIME